MQLTSTIARVEDASTIRHLAEVIWRDHYPGIISSAQIEYMLETMYGEAPLRTDLTRTDYQFTLFHKSGEPVGFSGCDFGREIHGLFLDKFYLLSSHQGQGLGQEMLASVEAQCRLRALGKIELRVNRNNLRAIRAYQNFGFEVVDEICSDIGEGFIMDDFLMRKQVA